MQDLFKLFISLDFRTQFTDDMNCIVSVYEGEGCKVHFPFYDHEVVQASNRIPYRLGAKHIFTLNSWSWIPFTQKAVLRKLLLQSVPRELLFRRKATMPSIQIAFLGPLGPMVKWMMSRWGEDLKAAVDEPERSMIERVQAALTSKLTYRFPEDHDLLWNAYSIAHLAILNQLCDRNEAVFDELRSWAGSVQSLAAMATA